MPFELPLNDATCDGLLFCMSQWANNVTNGLFFVFIIIAFCSVLFMATNRFGVIRSFGFASFSGLLAAIWLASMQLLEWWIASIFILLGVVGIVVMVLREDKRF